MFLKEVILQNFRGYKALRHRIAIEQLTAFIGKNDAGKSSIFDAIAVFFDHPLGKSTVQIFVYIRRIAASYALAAYLQTSWNYHH
ncbi:MAG: AAA family ATPase [Caldilineaceae bacterium]